MRSFALLAAAAAMSLTTAAGTAAAGDELRSFGASRLQVVQSCVTYHGVGLMTPAHSGQYGCYTRGGWVQCEQDGSCTGARFDRYDEESAQFARAPGVEGELSGRTTRLIPRHDR